MSGNSAAASHNSNRRPPPGEASIQTPAAGSEPKKPPLSAQQIMRARYREQMIPPRTWRQAEAERERLDRASQARNTHSRATYLAAAAQASVQAAARKQNTRGHTFEGQNDPKHIDPSHNGSGHTDSSHASGHTDPSHSSQTGSNHTGLSHTNSNHTDLSQNNSSPRNSAAYPVYSHGTSKPAQSKPAQPKPQSNAAQPSNGNGIRSNANRARANSTRSNASWNSTSTSAAASATNAAPRRPPLGRRSSSNSSIVSQAAAMAAQRSRNSSVSSIPVSPEGGRFSLQEGRHRPSLSSISSSSSHSRLGSLTMSSPIKSSPTSATFNPPSATGSNSVPNSASNSMATTNSIATTSPLGTNSATNSATNSSANSSSASADARSSSTSSSLSSNSAAPVHASNYAVPHRIHASAAARASVSNPINVAPRVPLSAKFVSSLSQALKREQEQRKQDDIQRQQREDEIRRVEHNLASSLRRRRPGPGRADSSRDSITVSEHRRSLDDDDRDTDSLKLARSPSVASGRSVHSGRESTSYLAANGALGAANNVLTSISSNSSAPRRTSVESSRSTGSVNTTETTSSSALSSGAGLMSDKQHQQYQQQQQQRHSQQRMEDSKSALQAAVTAGSRMEANMASIHMQVNAAVQAAQAKRDRRARIRHYLPAATWSAPTMWPAPPTFLRLRKQGGGANTPGAGSSRATTPLIEHGDYFGRSVSQQGAPSASTDGVHGSDQPSSAEPASQASTLTDSSQRTPVDASQMWPSSDRRDASTSSLAPSFDQSQDLPTLEFHEPHHRDANHYQNNDHDNDHDHDYHDDRNSRHRHDLEDPPSAPSSSSPANVNHQYHHSDGPLYDRERLSPHYYRAAVNKPQEEDFHGSTFGGVPGPDPTTVEIDASPEFITSSTPVTTPTASFNDNNNAHTTQRREDSPISVHSVATSHNSPLASASTPALVGAPKVGPHSGPHSRISTPELDDPINIYQPRQGSPAKPSMRLPHTLRTHQRRPVKQRDGPNRSALSTSQQQRALATPRDISGPLGPVSHHYSGIDPARMGLGYSRPSEPETPTNSGIPIGARNSVYAQSVDNLSSSGQGSTPSSVESGSSYLTPYPNGSGSLHHAPYSFPASSATVPPSSMPPALMSAPRIPLTLRGAGKRNRFNEEKPWKGHRSQNGLTERERKRYESLWMTNKGSYLPFFAVPEQYQVAWEEAVALYFQQQQQQQQQVVNSKRERPLSTVSLGHQSTRSVASIITNGSAEDRPDTGKASQSDDALHRVNPDVGFENLTEDRLLHEKTVEERQALDVEKQAAAAQRKRQEEQAERLVYANDPEKTGSKESQIEKNEVLDTVPELEPIGTEAPHHNGENVFTETDSVHSVDSEADDNEDPLVEVAKRANDIHGYAVARLWRRSRLPEDTLQQIWQLVDTNKDGTLDRSGFVIGMWLCDQCLYGRKLPAKVTPELWQSAGKLNLKIRVKPRTTKIGRLRKLPTFFGKTVGYTVHGGRQAVKKAVQTATS